MGENDEMSQFPAGMRSHTAKRDVKKFDLNIEKVLEDWGIPHAIREVIANALDEQALTNTKNVEVTKDKLGRWHIRDYGRGLRHEHLTQNENKEKLGSSGNRVGEIGAF